MRDSVGIEVLNQFCSKLQHLDRDNWLTLLYVPIIQSNLNYVVRFFLRPRTRASCGVALGSTQRAEVNYPSEWPVRNMMPLQLWPV